VIESEKIFSLGVSEKTNQLKMKEFFNNFGILDRINLNNDP
jgi:hypothetical protein